MTDDVDDNKRWCASKSVETMPSPSKPESIVSVTRTSAWKCDPPPLYNNQWFPLLCISSNTLPILKWACKCISDAEVYAYSCLHMPRKYFRKISDNRFKSSSWIQYCFKLDFEAKIAYACSVTLLLQIISTALTYLHVIYAMSPTLLQHQIFFTSLRHHRSNS